jgi:hypothetical protein
MGSNGQRWHVRRHLRRAFTVRSWPIRRKIAVGAWIPTVIVALILFTGPNRAVGKASPPAPTIPRPTVPLTPKVSPLVEYANAGLQSTRTKRNLHAAVPARAGVMLGRLGLHRLQAGTLTPAQIEAAVKTLAPTPRVRLVNGRRLAVSRRNIVLGGATKGSRTTQSVPSH